MLKNVDKIDNLIGNTPLIELKNVKEFFGLKATVYAKLEFLNPGGSVKDRPAKFMIDDAEKRGIITKGATIIEPTSGNTGIGLAMIGASRGYKVILTMPDTMSVERRNMLKSYGATVILTDGKLGMQGAVEKAYEIQRKTENSFIPSQFDNPVNTYSHYETTAPEIWEQLDGKISAFVAGVGSGATLSGVGKYLKEKNNEIKVYALEPQSSPLISLGKSGAHKIQGIGANFIPKNFDKTVCDGVLVCPDEMAVEYAKMLCQKEGLSVGISSGANLYGAIELAKIPEFEGKNIITVLPDNADRYYSTDLFKFE